MKKFQMICEDTLEEGLKLGSYFVCVSRVHSVKVAPKVISCQFYLF